MSARIALLVLAATAVIFLLSFFWQPGFNRRPWLEDYAYLKRHMEVAYANLEWMVERRGLDTRALDRRTLKTLESVRTDRAARRAIETFERDF